MIFLKVLVTALVLFLSTTLVVAQSDPLIWDATDEQLVKYVHSLDESKLELALQTIIMNPKILNSNKVDFNIYQLFRHHPNDKIRQMALVALYRLENYYLLKNLSDDLYKEKNPEIRRQILYILDVIPVLAGLD